MAPKTLREAAPPLKPPALKLSSNPLDGEDLITIPEAAKLFPRIMNAATVWRWALSGARGVKLETVLVGAKRYTSREAIERFQTRLNAEPGTPSAPDSRIKERIAKATARCKSRGA